jgi:hypothetical protein
MLFLNLKNKIKQNEKSTLNTTTAAAVASPVVNYEMQ